MPFDLPDFSDTHLATLLVVVSFALSAAVSCHAVLYKRDTRAVITWVGLAWLAPYLGAIAYFLLGINRVRRRAAALGFPRDWDNRDSLQLTPAEEERAGEFVHRRRRARFGPSQGWSPHGAAAGAARWLPGCG